LMHKLSPDILAEQPLECLWPLLWDTCKWLPALLRFVGNHLRRLYVPGAED
jgi:hypothetical protein